MVHGRDDNPSAATALAAPHDQGDGDADERDRHAIAFRLGVPWERLVELIGRDLMQRGLL